MITAQEIELSNNKAYINKDFTKVYEEILEIANKLSAKWQPSASNESDPGLVLLKLLAFVADKINYNVDKASLENRLPSATQDSSVRELCETNGYSPRYYRAATTKISVMYAGAMSASQTFTFPAYDTVFTDAESTIKYTLIKPITVHNRNQEVSGEAIQGTPFELVSPTTNSNLIQLTDLNDNNRIYFTDVEVAENGVYVRGQDNTTLSWKQVDNLNITEPGQLVYKFGYDSKEGRPYLEFPKDIASLIGSGLLITYILTDGADGNVKARYITQRDTTSTIYFDDTEEEVLLTDEDGNNLLGISNASASINGANPETINEAYNSFKKVVGTFETLVTCRDYANAIYLLESEDTTPLVSNVQVADRRTDINYSNNVITFNKYGLTKVSNVSDSTITPFELCLYPLKPIKYTYNVKTFNDSFKPLLGQADIKAAIEDLKLASHNYKTLSDNDIYALKNYYTLNAKITTNYKVNTFEQVDIKANIYAAIYKAFNARQVDFGYEIPYDSLLSVIQNADSRIKNVALDEPELNTMVMKATGEETALINSASTTAASYYIDLLAKNIVSGRLSLFDYDTDFTFDFGQAKSQNVSEYVLTVNGGHYKTEADIGQTYTITVSGTTMKLMMTRYISSTQLAVSEYEYTGKSLPATGTLTRVSGGTDTHNITYNSMVTNVLYGHKTDALTKKHMGIKTITTEVTIPTNSGELESRTLLENQVLQLIAPNLTEEIIYPYGINYAWLPSDGTLVLAKDVDYKLTGTDKFIIQYTDDNDNYIVRVYSATDVKDENGTVIKTAAEVIADGGNIIKPNFALAPTASSTATETKVITVSGTDVKLYTLSTNAQVSIRKFVRAVISDSDLQCYWVTRRPNNALFIPGVDDVYVRALKFISGTQYYTKSSSGYTAATVTDEETFLEGDYYIKAMRYILQENEYFLYTNGTQTELESVGSGTQLTYFDTITAAQASKWQIAEDEGSSLEEINDSGLAAFKDYPWVHKNFKVVNFELQEMQILTLTSGDTIEGVVLDSSEPLPGGGAADVSKVDNQFRRISQSSEIYYTLFGEETATALPNINIDSIYWQIRSRLDLNAGPSMRQLLKENEVITFDIIDKITSTTSQGVTTYTYETSPVFVKQDGNNATYIEFNSLLQIIGGIQLDMATINTNGESGYDLEAYVYNYTQPTFKETVTEGSATTDVDTPIERINNYISIPFASYKMTSTTVLPLIRLVDESQLLMMHFENSHITVTIVPTGGTIKKYGGSSTASLTLSQGINVIEIGAGVTQLAITITSDSAAAADKQGSLTIGTLDNILGYNSNLFPTDIFADPTNFITALETKISSLSGGLFYYNHPLDGADLIEVNDMTSPLALFDSNNIANKFTICQIDFNNINIDIARTSRV